MSVLIINPEFFAKEVKRNLDINFDDYEIFLRLNCEGSEDEIIYSFKKVFQKKLKYVLGSLSDVKDIIGIEDYRKLLSFLKKNKIKFEKFNSSIETWNKAFKCLKVIVQNSNKLID